MTTYTIIQTIFLILFALASGYILVFAVAGKFYRQKPQAKAAGMKKIVVLIPGYREDEVIVEVAQSALEQYYPMSLFDVVVIADSFKAETLQKLKTLPIKVIEVMLENRTKAKALNKGMESLKRDYDIAVVLDADNIMAKDFLLKINASFDEGLIAVQGHRQAKNKNNTWAVLDTVSEEINNHIFRKGHRALGLSSALIGSGMAFDYKYFKDIMSSVKAIGGFDKELELRILKDKHTIGYLNNALVYDEKIQQAEVFSNQKRRWLSAQFYYFRKGFPNALLHLVTKGNIDYFNKAIQFIQPPRILLLGGNIVLSLFFIVSNYFLKMPSIFSMAWTTISVACIFSLMISIPGSLLNQNTLKALLGLPKGMWLMFRSLLKIKNANKKFIHTQHGTQAVNIP